MPEQMSTDALELYCRNRAKAAGGLTEYDRALLMDVSDRLCALQSENAERGKEIERLTKKATLNAFIKYAMKRACEELVGTETALTRVEAERDGYKRALHLAIETHSVDQRQIDRLERYYLEQARGAQGEG